MQLKGQAPALEGDRLPQGTLRRGKLHELETLRALLESALVQVQMPAEPRSLH